MKTLIALCLVTTLGFSTAQAAQQEGNPQAAKLARDASAAAKDQDWNKAIDLLRKASEMDRKFTTNLAIAYEQRAYSYANDQRFQDALNDLAEAIKIKPGDARAYEQRAAIYIRISDNDKALEDYAEAMKANPGEIKYRNYRAYIYESRGD
jgi:tetratricopeptide (TPR) repeat protein